MFMCNNTFVLFQCTPKVIRFMSTAIAINRPISQIIAVITIVVLYIAALIALVSNCISLESHKI